MKSMFCDRPQCSLGSALPSAKRATALVESRSTIGMPQFTWLPHGVAQLPAATQADVPRGSCARHRFLVMPSDCENPSPTQTMYPLEFGRYAAFRSFGFIEHLLAVFDGISLHFVMNLTPYMVPIFSPSRNLNTPSKVFCTVTAPVNSGTSRREMTDSVWSAIRRVVQLNERL